MKHLNFSKILPVVGIGLLILIAFLGLFDRSASEFVSKALSNNLELIEAVESLQFIMTGVESVKVPFVSNYAGKIAQDIAQVESYLLLATALNFVQYILMAINQSFLFDLALVVLFVFTWFPKGRRLSSKYLVLALALNPGLLIYTTGMQQLAHYSAIDFGAKYIGELQADIDTLKTEKTQLMLEHEQALVKISNGEEGFQPFRRLKEDVAYDLKKTKVEIHGDYAKLRHFFRDAGYEVTAKVVGFFSMVLITMLLLPLVYFALIYMLYKQLFDAKLDWMQLESLFIKPNSSDNKTI